MEIYIYIKSGKRKEKKKKETRGAKWFQIKMWESVSWVIKMKLSSVQLLLYYTKYKCVDIGGKHFTVGFYFILALFHFIKKIECVD